MDRIVEVPSIVSLLEDNTLSNKLDLTSPLAVKVQRKETNLLTEKIEIASLKTDLSRVQDDIDARNHHHYF
ncbi:hypothetical protein P5673_033213 [Acropora cervicornis]|uniref:Uncharacterized protein n=1 Tax=Acropora cervicornis TaxID=6130 RepID=A0AAD9PQB6_ACRCE|nr:hypothetical protein P5673_033213 [Acropora cervicornis]